MTKTEANQYLNAAHVYAGVTAIEAVNCPHAKYLTEVNGVTLLGCDQPYDAIASKELLDAA